MLHKSSVKYDIMHGLLGRGVMLAAGSVLQQAFEKLGVRIKRILICPNLLDPCTTACHMIVVVLRPVVNIVQCRLSAQIVFSRSLGGPVSPEVLIRLQYPLKFVTDYA